jgi:hypothetical protein
LAAAGCSTRTCRDQTAFVTLDLDSASAAADTLKVVISVDNAMSQESTRPRASRGTREVLEIIFDHGYPTGSKLDLTVSALANGNVVGIGSARQTLVPGCTAFSLAVGGNNLDAALDFTVGDAEMDLSSFDQASVDLSPDSSPAIDLSGCPYLYVSPTGNDTDPMHDGCKPERAFASVTKAVSQLGILMSGQEVHVCKGIYGESSLNLSGIVKGGYDCTSWQRTATYGYPTFDGTNETTVIGASAQAIRVPTTAASNTLIDGFTFTGVASDPLTAVGLLVQAPAVISNNRIVGGGSSTGDIGSIGLEVNADADIFYNSINGGSGITNGGFGSFGSVAVARRAAGRPYLHQNLIDGGTGSATTFDVAVGSLGILLAGPATELAPPAGKPIEGNQITGGTGTNSVANGTASRAMHIATGISVDILDNVIDGGSPRFQGAAHGIFSFNAADLRILRNRIFGGIGRGSQTIFVNTNNSALIQNNMILAGNSVDAGWSEAVWVIQNNVKILDNTIVTGNSGSASFNNGIHLVSTMSGAVVDNNIVAASGGVNSYAFYVEQCPNQGVIASLQNNLTFFNTIFRYGPSPSPGPCTPGGTFTSDDGMQSDILTKCGSAAGLPCNTFNGGSGAAASGNLNFISATCGSDSGCFQVAACTTAAECLRAVFGAWDGPSNGKTNLTGSGWLLNSSDTCRLTRGGLDLTGAGVTDDLFKMSRTAPLSIGAHEFDGMCCSAGSC